MPFTNFKWNIIKVLREYFLCYVLVPGFCSCPLGWVPSPAYLAHSSSIEVLWLLVRGKSGIWHRANQ